MTRSLGHRSGACARIIGYGLIASVPLSVGGAASAKTDFVVNGGLNIRAATNPYLTAGTDQGSTSVSAIVAPALTMRDAESELTLSGAIQHFEYQRLYGSSDSLSAGLDGRWRFSPRWTATAAAKFDESIVGENDRLNFNAPAEPVGPQPIIDSVPQIIGDDLALLGTRTRTRSIGVQAGLIFQPNGREIANLGLFANNSRALTTLVNDQNYSTYGGVFGYSRQIRPRTSAGFTTTVSRYECRSAARCYVNSFQPQLTISTVIGVDWTLKGSAGATFSKIELPSQSGNSVSPAGSISLCRDKARVNMCLSASRTVENSVGTGARPTLAVFSNITYRFERNTNVGLYLAYNRSGASAFSQQDFSSFSARVTGSRQLSRRVSFTVDGGYDRSDTPVVGSRSNLSASVGLNFSLGRRA